MRLFIRRFLGVARSRAGAHGSVKGRFCSCIAPMMSRPSQRGWPPAVRSKMFWFGRMNASTVRYRSVTVMVVSTLNTSTKTCLSHILTGCYSTSRRYSSRCYRRAAHRLNRMTHAFHLSSCLFEWDTYWVLGGRYIACRQNRQNPSFPHTREEHRSNGEHRPQQRRNLQYLTKNEYESKGKKLTGNKK